ARRGARRRHAPIARGLPAPARARVGGDRTDARAAPAAPAGLTRPVPPLRRQVLRVRLRRADAAEVPQHRQAAPGGLPRLPGHRGLLSVLARPPARTPHFASKAPLKSKSHSDVICPLSWTITPSKRPTSRLTPRRDRMRHLFVRRHQTGEDVIAQSTRRFSRIRALAVAGALAT